MNKYEIIIFDLDDTLINNLENIRYAYKKMVEFVGKPYTETDFNKWYDFDKQFWIDRHDGKIVIPEEYLEPKEKKVEYIRSLRYFMYFEGKITLETAFEINKLYINSLHENVIPIEGAYEILKYLHNKYKIVIATNGPSLAVESKLNKINSLDLIDNIFSADMTKQTVSKPKKEYFDELMNHISYYNKDKMLIIGDSLHSEVKGGMDSKIDTCWFNPNNEKLPNEYKPTYIINQLEELTKIL